VVDVGELFRAPRLLRRCVWEHNSFGLRLTFFFCQARNAAPAALNAASIQSRTYADKASPTEVSSILEQRIRGVQEEAGLAETGRVLSVGYVQCTRKLVEAGKC
jgi:hypothetical protein